MVVVLNDRKRLYQLRDRLAELQPPLLCCSRCKKKAYCSKACQVYLLLQLLHHHARAACGVCLGFGKV